MPLIAGYAVWVELLVFALGAVSLAVTSLLVVHRFAVRPYERSGLTAGGRDSSSVASVQPSVSGDIDSLRELITDLRSEMVNLRRASEIRDAELRRMAAHAEMRIRALEDGLELARDAASRQAVRELHRELDALAIAELPRS